MSSIILKTNISTRVLKPTKAFSTAALKNDDEYTSTPRYPPILDLSFLKRLERKKQAVYDEIKAVKTVEEKQIKLNMPRFYGFKNYMLSDKHFPYNSLPFAQHITRTHLIKDSELPELYKDVDAENVGDLAEEIQEALLMEIDCIQKLYDLKNDDISAADKEDLVTSRIVKQINRVLMNNLVEKHQHLKDLQVDLEPRIETNWYVGGMNPPRHIQRSRNGLDHMKEYVNDPTDRLMCYINSPSLAIRSELPLPSVIPHSESENPSLEVPYFKYDPRVLGISTEHRHIANIPGFWPGDRSSFGILSINKRSHIARHSSQYNDQDDTRDALYTHGILSSYAWLHAQANFLGFTTFNDITYPIVTQTMVTNGKEWSFFIYQLNTILLHSKYVKENPKRNICWASKQHELYEKVEDGKLCGLNEDTLKMLVKMYGLVPEERLGVNLRPYLSREEKVSADYEDEDKRQWLEREYKFLVANRPRYREFDEIYSWEKIYKIDNKTRPMDKKLRFFELFQKPHKRTLDNRLANYIPRCLRPDLPRHKGRYAKEYFP